MKCKYIGYKILFSICTVYYRKQEMHNHSYVRSYIAMYMQIQKLLDTYVQVAKNEQAIIDC